MVRTGIFGESMRFTDEVCKRFEGRFSAEDKQSMCDTARIRVSVCRH